MTEKLTDRKALAILNEGLLQHLQKREFNSRPCVAVSKCKQLRALDIVIIKWMDGPDTEHLVFNPPKGKDKCFGVITATDRLNPRVDTVNFDQVVAIAKTR